MTAHVMWNGLRGEQYEVVLVAEIDGHQVLWVQTATTRVELTVSPKGRTIRVIRGLPPVNFGNHGPDPMPGIEEPEVPSGGPY